MKLQYDSEAKFLKLCERNDFPNRGQTVTKGRDETTIWQWSKVLPDFKRLMALVCLLHDCKFGTRNVDWCTTNRVRSNYCMDPIAKIEYKRTITSRILHSQLQAWRHANMENNKKTWRCLQVTCIAYCYRTRQDNLFLIMSQIIMLYSVRVYVLIEAWTV